jgi:4-hydroxybenzoyl-CoA thioesterase/acyl-CoA thioester hydrolase
MAEIFRTTRLVEFHDTDMAGIMHFASFFHYMESAEHEFLRSIGFSIYSKWEGHTLSFPRVAVSCEFRSPARCEDLLEIAIRVSRLGTKSLTYEFTFTHEGREVAHGQMTAVCCRIDPSQPLESVPIPPPVAKKLRQYVV